MIDCDDLNTELGMSILADEQFGVFRLKRDRVLVAKHNYGAVTVDTSCWASLAHFSRWDGEQEMSVELEVKGAVQRDTGNAITATIEITLSDAISLLGIPFSKMVEELKSRVQLKHYHATKGDFEGYGAHAGSFS